jgi:hypothetical protein
MTGLIFSLVLIAPSNVSAAFHEYILTYRDDGEIHNPSNMPDGVENSNISSIESGFFISHTFTFRASLILLCQV